MPPAASGDAMAALSGRAIEAIAGGEDAILRIGQPGMALPGESVLDVWGDRVLSAVASPGGEPARLIVRDLEGTVLHEIDAGFNLPQAGIVRGDVVFFAGVQADPDADPLEVEDRGIWLARGDEPPRAVFEPSGTQRYEELHLSPDGAILGAWACGTTCRSILIPDTGEVVVIDRPGLTALTNERAILLTSWTGIAGYDVTDGAQRWEHESGSNWGRHAMLDGRHIVHTSITDGDDDGRSADGYRIEVIDGTTGEVERTIDIPTDEISWSLSPTLSTDRYGVLVPAVLPDAADAPIGLMVVDLADGSLVDVDLALESVPPAD